MSFQKAGLSIDDDDDNNSSNNNTNPDDDNSNYILLLLLLLLLLLTTVTDNLPYSSTLHIYGSAGVEVEFRQGPSGEDAVGVCAVYPLL